MSRETSFPRVMEIDSSMNITTTSHHSNLSFVQHIDLFKYNGNLYSKIERFEGSIDNIYSLTLNRLGNPIWIKFESNNIDTVEISLDHYFNTPPDYSSVNDTLIISGVSNSYG